MNTFFDIETPAPIVELAGVEHNLQKMQAYCDRHDVKLRSHIKRTSCLNSPSDRLRSEPSGSLCQKLTEAEVVADDGLVDILISYPMIDTLGPTWRSSSAIS